MLVLFKRFLSKYLLLIEFCKKCGVKQPLVWSASDELWNRVSGDYNVLCPNCFNTIATQKGIHVQWQVTDNVN